MTVEISVKSDLDEVVDRVARRYRDQVPFAAARALTLTAKDAAAAITSEIDKAFDRPTAITRKAIGSQYANKQTLTARVFVKDIQAAYLGLQISGGERLPKSRALVVPGRTFTLNQYGNMPKGKIKQLLARADVFSGTVRGIPGIWQRTKGRGAKLLVLYEPRATYRPRLNFYGVGRAVIDARLLPNFEQSLKDAIASAR